MASERAYAHPRLNANAEGPAKKEVGYLSAMLADGTIAVRSVPRGFGISRLRRQLFKE
jgi:hypothetical protein